MSASKGIDIGGGLVEHLLPVGTTRAPAQVPPTRRLDERDHGLDGNLHRIPEPNGMVEAVHKGARKGIGVDKRINRVKSVYHGLGLSNRVNGVAIDIESDRNHLI